MLSFFTRIYLHAALLFVPILFTCCTNKVTCHEISGRWTNHEGQEFLFQEGGKAMWLTRFGSQYDTVLFEYYLNCNADPAAIDLKHFYTGPFSGKTLFGILEWTSDTSFRMQYEPGLSAEVRPEKFNGEEVMRFSPAR